MRRGREANWRLPNGAGERVLVYILEIVEYPAKIERYCGIRDQTKGVYWCQMDERLKPGAMVVLSGVLGYDYDWQIAEDDPT